MKKAIAFIFVLLILLAGCNADIRLGSPDSAEKTLEPSIEHFEPTVWTDTQTGCEYLVAQPPHSTGGITMTPRMDIDGSQICN